MLPNGGFRFLLSMQKARLAEAITEDVMDVLHYGEAVRIFPARVLR